MSWSSKGPILEPREGCPRLSQMHLIGSLPSILWQTPPKQLALRSGEIHLWRILLAERLIDPETCWPLLNPEQRLRTRSLRDPDLRMRYAQARAGLNLILAKYLGRPTAQIQIQRAPHGKPRLCGPDAWLRFSFTHSGELALVALSAEPQAELGVDCEQIRPRRHLLAIAQRLFDAETLTILSRLPEPLRLEPFYQAWTALEARVKWDGRGLFAPPEPDTPLPQTIHFIPAPGYCAAVACLNIPPLSDWLTLDLSDPFSKPT